jgi:hypothetical protein
VQLKRWWITTALAAGTAMTWTPRCDAVTIIDDQTTEWLMQMFVDSDHVGVRSAIANYELSLASNSSLSLHWNNEQVRIPAISAPPGTQEAVDAITTASRPIAGNAFQDFVKTRNEFQADLKRGPANFGYYYSSEPDYLGQQVIFGYNRDFDDAQVNLAVGSSLGWDAIDPVADDDTQTAADSKTTLHWNAVATRVLTPTTLVRLGLEYNIVNGLQHNPYRNVYAGGTRVPERHPGHRERRDAFLKVNQYFQNRSSLKFNYRFYDDDWGIDSHELGSTLSQYITRGVFASYEYRYYTQTAADFYRDEYATVAGVDGYLSGDYRMAVLSSHLFGFAFDVDLRDLAMDAPVFGRMGLRFNYEHYFNSNNYSANILTTQAVYHF